MLGKLLPSDGGASIPLLKPSLLLGRKSDCDIPIACSSVSGHHCRLEFKDGSWWVLDLDSRNGTSINGRRITEQRISPRDVLTLGRQKLVVDYQAAKHSRTNPSAKSSEKKSTRRKLSKTRASSLSADDEIALAFLNLSRPEDQQDTNLPSENVVSSEPVSNVSPSPVMPDAEVVTAAPAPVPAHIAEPGPRPLPPVELGRLIPEEGGDPIVLTSPEMTIGRGRGCDIPIRLPSISSRHCKLILKDGYWHVEDLNSTNGTSVDGERCLFDVLMPGSTLTLHKHHYKVEYVPASDAPPPIVRQLFSQSLLEKAGFGMDLTDGRLGGVELEDDDSDRPKRYNLLDSDDSL
ncbi:FHA domain-containing protein [Schlesneria sp. T3-172]|uniref:FHA domain-containing protein n=1 Tax=Schlesneria sphaerica TaxID=3373610 RepID=UPI0037CC5E68